MSILLTENTHLLVNFNSNFLNTDFLQRSLIFYEYKLSVEYNLSFLGQKYLQTNFQRHKKYLHEIGHYYCF